MVGNGSDIIGEALETTFITDDSVAPFPLLSDSHEKKQLIADGLTPTANFATVSVNLANHHYDILIGQNIIEQLGSLIKNKLRRRSVRIVTDQQVAKAHLFRLLNSLKEADLDVGLPFILPGGEEIKSFEYFQQLCEELIDSGIERSTLIIALGGGVIGDLTGFVASACLRGLDFVQVPTTLLAQVDSSVGGKTGINAGRGKNLVGAFHQPSLVIADMNVLSTLPERQLKAGYAEIVKYGLINDEGFFAWLEYNGLALLAGDVEAREYAVKVSCTAKAAIVQKDERESGLRALLNLGHSFGHALEAINGYNSDLLHGEAVSIGMVLAFELSVRLGLCEQEDCLRVKRHLKMVGLPTHIPDYLNDHRRLVEFMRKDKKVKDGKLHFVLARGIGHAFITPDVTEEDVLAMLAEHQSSSLS